VALAEGFTKAGQSLDARQAIMASADVAAHARAAVPGLWAFDLAAARSCADDYRWTGWAGLIPLDAQWSTWGWPNRFLTRMASANTRTILTGPAKSGGVTMVEQIPEIPRDFKGAVWVEDISAIGPALRN
jgi:glycerophosphoryl diester phosphodiesterase